MLIETVLPAEVAEHPLASVIVTEYEPAAETEVVCVVAPLDHK